MLQAEGRHWEEGWLALDPLRFLVFGRYDPFDEGLTQVLLHVRVLGEFIRLRPYGGPVELAKLSVRVLALPSAV